MNKIKRVAILICLFLFNLFLSGCITIPKQTVELSEITDKQIVELHKSYIQFVGLYYSKLRDDVNNFIDNKWIPVFLSKAVQNKPFRKDLDEAYIISNIEPSYISIKWKGKPLPEPQNSAVLSGIKAAVTDIQSRLGSVLLEWSKEAQRQINIKRRELLEPIDIQERMVIDEINGAFADLQRSHSVIRGYLASAVELKEKQTLVLEKLGALEKTHKIMDTALDVNEKLSTVLKSNEDIQQIIDNFLKQIKKSYEDLKDQSSSKNKNK